MYAPNTNGILGDTARALSPQVAYRIGQYFKENKVKNQQDNGNRPEEQSLQHLMAHAILGAATSYATGNDIATGALAGATSEKTAPILASYLYGKDPKELSQEQKDAITSVLSLDVATGVGAIKGVVNTSRANKLAQAEREVDRVKVENNIGRDEDVFYKPIKITGEPKDLKEYNDASKFTYLNGGGEFKFSETKNQQGIEGYFVNQLGDKIPVSLKNLETSSPRKVMTVINKNAKSILEAEALPSNNPHKLPIGTLNDTVLHIQTPNISKQQLVDELTNYPFQGNGGKYKIIIFETKDGGFTLQNGKIESYPK